LPSGTDTQVNVQLPVDAPIGPTTLTVTAGGQTSAPMNLTLAAYAPAFFTANASGSGVGSFVDGLTGKVLSAANPAEPGENIAATAVRLGATTPAYATGATATGAASTAAKATIAIGAESVAPAYAGTAPSFLAAVYQVNFAVPKDATACATNVVLTIGGVSSPPVTLPIATPMPALFAIQNAATASAKDAAHAAAPNSFVAVYVASLGEKRFHGHPIPGHYLSGY
jgi:uncharacterized protein (TIGR03437 family)